MNKKTIKTYYGVSKAKIDNNTIFYATFDGTTTAEIGSVHAIEGADSYAPNSTGLGISPNNITADKPITIKIKDMYRHRNNMTIDMFLHVGNILNTDTAIQCGFGTNNKWVKLQTSQLISNSINHIRLIVDNDKRTAYVNGKESIITGDSSGLEENVYLLISIGYGSDTSTLNSPTIEVLSLSDLHISNINKGDYFPSLPPNFIEGKAIIAPVLSGQRKTSSDKLTSQVTQGKIRAKSIDRNINMVYGVKDEANANESKLVQRTKRVVLTADNITGLYTQTENIDYVIFNRNTDHAYYDIQTQLNQTIISDIGISRTYSILDDISNIGYFIGISDKLNGYVVAKGTYNTFEEAKADLAGTIITYQLKTPIIYNINELKSSKGLSSSQQIKDKWSLGDTIKVKGLTGEVISGIVDSNTSISQIISVQGAKSFIVDNISGLTENDTISIISKEGTQYDTTISSVNTDTNLVTVTDGDFSSWEFSRIYETTPSTSSPVAYFMKDGVKTILTSSTWSGLGTNEAILTLGEETGLVDQEIQIDYSLNIQAGQGHLPVYSNIYGGKIGNVELIPKDEIVIIDDLKGKTMGSNIKCPHSIYSIVENELTSINYHFNEFTTEQYSMVDSGDSQYRMTSSDISGNIPQHLFKFNLINIVERKYGEIPSIDKIQWLKDNIYKVTSEWVGFASNNSHFAKYYNGSWTSYNTTSNLIDSLQSDGNIYLLAYADASNGTTQSAIYTNYISMRVQLKNIPDYITLVPKNNRSREDGANVVLLRPQTREIRTMFNNYSNIEINGEYIPQAEKSETTTVTILEEYDYFLLTDLSSAVGDKQGNHHWKNILWRLHNNPSNLMGEFGYAKIPLAEDSKGVNIGSKVSISSEGYTDGFVKQYGLPVMSKPIVAIGRYLVLHNGEVKLFVASYYETEGKIETRYDGVGCLIPLKGKMLVNETEGYDRESNYNITEWRTPTGEIQGFIDKDGNLLATYQ